MRSSFENPTPSNIRHASGLKQPWRRLVELLLCGWVYLILAVDLRSSTTCSEGDSLADSQQSRTIQAWDFGRDEDPNKEAVPYYFERKRGREYPPYLQVQIVPKHPENKDSVEETRRLLSRLWMAYDYKKMPWEVVPETVPPNIDRFLERTLLDPCLQMQLDGGAIELRAPAFPVEPAYSYAFEIDMECSGLVGHQAFAEMAVLDQKQNVLYTKSTKVMQGNTDWTRMRIDRVDISNEKDAMGQIRIVVLPTRKGAWKGQVRVDRIRVLKMPQLSIALNRPMHLYRQGEAVEVTCNASGLIANVPDIELYVVDQYLQTIEQISLPIQQTGKAPLPAPSQIPGPSGVKLASKNSDATIGWKGTAKWIIPTLPPGFYTVRCVLARSTSGIPFTRDTTFCILPKDDINSGDRRFGWSFADRNQSIPLTQLPNFLQLCCIRGAKIPIWIDSNDEKASEEQSWLIEKLKAQDIDIVGVLDMPPKTEQRFFANAEDLTFDTVWEQENVWRTLIDPIVSRISLQLSSIQVGRDRDFSFVGNERLQPKIASLQKLIELYGPSSQLIVPWSALHPPMSKSESSSKVYQYSIDPPWTAAELQSFVKHASQSDQKYWINLEGLAPITLDKETGPRNAQRYSIENCLSHLTDSMVAFVKSGASKAWVGSAMDPDQSWMQNGQPGLMLLPFRTLSQALAEKEYVGRLDFPNKSICHVLQNGPDGVMILSNPRETTEQLYIGEQPIATDLFGREVPLVVSNSGFGTERKFLVGPRPIIVRGINVDVAKWSMGLEVEDPIIETTTSGKQSLRVTFSNPTKSALRGTIRITAPEILQGDPLGTEFKVDAMGKQNVDVGLTLLPDATSQSAQLRIDIEVQSAKVYRFSVYRKVRVGQDDLELLVHQRIDDSNNLILQLEFLNRTGRTLSLDCQIVPPSRPRMKREILDFNERTERTIVLSNASELVGKTINFRAQEFGSDRVVNQRIVVSPP